MGKISCLLVVFTLTIILCVNVSAAPAPTLFTYNDSLKQCGTFRDGDEFVSYTLPQDWLTYDYNRSIAKTTQQYCDELGYKNIGNIVSYLHLKPKVLRTPSPNYPYETRQFNYPLLIITILITTGAVTGVALYLHNRPKKTE